jgi:hypothetical protein
VILQPLDPLGAALRTAYERARHDIDWSGHPLMHIYLEHSRVKVRSAAALKGHARKKVCSASQPPA